MPLKHNLTLEDALAQFDAITARIVLHLLKGEVECQESRREHVYCAARDTYLAASIWQEALQKYHTSEEKLDSKLARRFISDINSCQRALDQVVNWYSGIERTQTELVKEVDPSHEERYSAESLKLKSIKTEKNHIINFQSLLTLTGSYASQILREYSRREEIETPADPPKIDG